MFNRVAGGNFTKSADISSDILNKLRHDLPEDDPRIPNVLADFIGDNDNDIAGNCSDLLESFVATLVASQLIANIVYKQNGVEYQAIYEKLAKYTQEYIDNKYPCGDGGWIHYRVTCQEHYEDIKKLLAVKCS